MQFDQLRRREFITLLGGAGDRRALGLGEQGIHPGGGAGVKVDAVWTYIFSRAQQTRSGAELH